MEEIKATVRCVQRGAAKPWYLKSTIGLVFLPVFCSEILFVLIRSIPAFSTDLLPSGSFSCTD